MGYYTHFEMEVDTTHSGRLGMIAERINSDDEASYALHHLGGCEWESSEPTRWYGHETFLRALSADFPGVLFTLSGEGEESGDIWKKYFRDGMCQEAKARIEIDAFDPARLA